MSVWEDLKMVRVLQSAPHICWLGGGGGAVPACRLRASANRTCLQPVPFSPTPSQHSPSLSTTSTLFRSGSTECTTKNSPAPGRQNSLVALGLLLLLVRGWWRTRHRTVYMLCYGCAWTCAY
jgi:hypothetical protein